MRNGTEFIAWSFAQADIILRSVALMPMRWEQRNPHLRPSARSVHLKVGNFPAHA